MTIEGTQLIGREAVLATGEAFHAIDPSTGETLQPAFATGGQAEVERASELARAAFDSYRETGLEARARFLETIADKIE
ncbi:aldehyde dehydrogenase family protein, partial [Halomonas elongata]